MYDSHLTIKVRNRRLRIDSTGFWFHGPKHDVAYWHPWAWMPFHIRKRKHWWGALRVGPLL